MTVITSKDLYDALTEFRKEMVNSLEKIQEKVNNQCESIIKIEEHLKTQNGKIKDIEDRLDGVEEEADWSKSKILMGLGGIAVTSLIVGLISIFSTFT